MCISKINWCCSLAWEQSTWKLVCEKFTIYSRCYWLDRSARNYRYQKKIHACELGMSILASYTGNVANVFIIHHFIFMYDNSIMFLWYLQISCPVPYQHQEKKIRFFCKSLADRTCRMSSNEDSSRHWHVYLIILHNSVHLGHWLSSSKFGHFPTIRCQAYLRGKDRARIVYVYLVLSDLLFISP